MSIQPDQEIFDIERCCAECGEVFIGSYDDDYCDDCFEKGEGRR